MEINQRTIAVTELENMEHSIVKLDARNLITKDNKLIEAKYRLSKSEAQLIFTVISQINPQRDEDFKSYKINVDDFMKFINTKTKDTFGRIEAVVDKLQQNILKIKLDPKSNRYTKVGWIMAAEYNPDKREIYIMLHRDLKPFLLGLKEKFTSYRLEYIISLKSVFSIRLYELLKQYENTKHRTRFFTVDELKDKLEIKSKYPSYGMFKQRILITAQKELKEKTDIYFDFEEITEKKESEKGRKKVIGLKFIIITKREEETRPEYDIQVLPLAKSIEPSLFDGQKTEDNPEEMNILVRAGISSKEAKKISSLKYDYVIDKMGVTELLKSEITFREYILSKIYMLEVKKRKGGELENPAGWLKEAIKNNYVDPTIEKAKKEEKKNQERRLQEASIAELKKKYQKVNGLWENEIRLAHNTFLASNPDAIKKAIELYKLENNGELPILYNIGITPEENYKAKTFIRMMLDFKIQKDLNPITAELLTKKEYEIESIKKEIIRLGGTI